MSRCSSAASDRQQAASALALTFSDSVMSSMAARFRTGAPIREAAEDEAGEEADSRCGRKESTAEGGSSEAAAEAFFSAFLLGPFSQQR